MDEQAAFDYAMAHLADLYTHARWRRARAAFLRLNRSCVATRHAPGCDRRGTVVDHVVPRSTARNDAELRHLTWDRSNWQALSKVCHDAKTRLEQFGPSRVMARAAAARSAAAPSASRVVTTDYSSSGGTRGAR